MRRHALLPWIVLAGCASGPEPIREPAPVAPREDVARNEVESAPVPGSILVRIDDVRFEIDTLEFKSDLRDTERRWRQRDR